MTQPEPEVLRQWQKRAERGNRDPSTWGDWGFSGTEGRGGSGTTWNLRRTQESQAMRKVDSSHTTPRITFNSHPIVGAVNGYVVFVPSTSYPVLGQSPPPQYNSDRWTARELKAYFGCMVSAAVGLDQAELTFCSPSRPTAEVSTLRKALSRRERFSTTFSKDTWQRQGIAQ